MILLELNAQKLVTQLISGLIIFQFDLVFYFNLFQFVYVFSIRMSACQIHVLAVTDDVYKALGGKTTTVTGISVTQNNASMFSSRLTYRKQSKYFSLAAIQLVSLVTCRYYGLLSTNYLNTLCNHVTFKVKFSLSLIHI